MRPLNSVTIFSVYPMPSIDGALTRLHGAKIFSIMDLESGYWQIPMKKEDREKTAFATTDGAYRFLVMPFGLCTAQSTFQRTMDTVLGGLRWTSCLVYLDDIIVYAGDTTEHIRRLRQVLSALRKANLKLKLAKCRFGESAIIALGHKINADGISPDPEKVKAVQNFPKPPATESRAGKVKFIKSFLGLCSFYRRHTPGFAEVAKPLFDLTKEKTLFIWTSTHQESFDKLKKMLTEAATLAYPDPSAEFEIHPDACGYGIGAVLLQKQGGTEKPLAFASRLMSRSEQNYSITEKECLALIWAVKKFRQFIFGCPIKIVTDHHALCWLQSKTDLAGRLARWSMTISEYKYVITHRNGKLHQDADALSRYPLNEDNDTPDNTWGESSNTVGVMTQDNRDELTKGQQDEWAYVFKNAENGKETVNYIIENGLLYRIRITGEEETDAELRLCIPKNLRTTILQACHDDITSGHLGETRTYDRVTQRYFWHGISRDIERYIKACPDCQSRKKGQYRKPSGFLELTHIEKPWDRVGMDILGPFPTSSLGNRYIVVAVDYVTKWAEAVALHTAGAKQVAEFFVTEILLRHGAPRKLTTDQGKCFVATMMQRVLAAMETNHQTTTAYHPQANGLVERLNHTLADMLSMYVSRDHKDWDTTLPFVRFAYNTSRQETTGKSPFYLMHGRHPVLPIDTIFGADPDPRHLVPVESGGPENYEMWMLGNLQRAFAEVDTRSQRAQRKYKQHYDKQRREGERFQPSQQVLVYRPTRKVGLAEKLLHRWHGPYNIIRQITPLNYEVQLNPYKKTEIVHVERLKSFVNLTDPGPTKENEAQTATTREKEETTDETNKDDDTPAEENEAQTADTTDNEETAEEANTDDDTPAEPQHKRTSRPKKQQKEKKVKFTTADDETQQTNTETEKPTTQDETNQNRRYPLRIRKKRFALASTLLYSMMLLSTAHTTPAETVAQASSTTPAIWWSITLLLTTMRTTPTDGALEVKLSSHGVIFQSLGERFSSDSEWVIVTDISFDQGDKVTNDLKSWLTEKTKLYITGSSSNKDFLSIIPSAKASDRTSKIQTQDILSLIPSNAEKAQQQLTTIIRDRAASELTRLETIERNYQGLKASIIQKRNKRGLVDGGGKILNWLFGVSTTEELDKVNNQVAKLSTETTAIVHALETHTTLINETIWELQANKETTDALQRSCMTLDKELNNAKRTADNLAREIEWDWKSRDKIDNAFRAVDITIEWLQQLVERLSGGLASAAMEKISPALFPPTQLQTVITEIKNQLPTGWALTPATQAGDMWKSYQEATVTAAATENGIRLFAHIPIFEFTRTLTLYRVIGLARATTNGLTSVQYAGLPQYLATSPDQQTFIELSSEMVGPCRATKKPLCPISRAVSRKSNKGTCSVAIFLADDRRIQEDCAVVVTPCTGQDAVYLGHRQWGLSAINTTRLIITCPRITTRPNSYTIDTPAISIFEIPMACTAQSDDWIFQASFRKDTNKKWITRTAPQLANLRTPGRPMTTIQEDRPTQHADSKSEPAHKHLQELSTDMIHQMDGLSDLEHARLDPSDTPNYNRYPWEWIGILVLCILGIGSTIIADRNTTTNRQISPE